MDNMNTVKPVSLEMELDFHERLLHTVGKSIASTKKRLHDAELILNLRPPDHEEAEIQEWNVKVSQLIDKRGPLEFPTLYKVRKEYESKALIKSIRNGRQRIESDEKFNQRMSRRLAKEAEMIKKKVLSESASFGKKITGGTIRTIDDYQGLNTMYPGSRTLIRKEGAYIPLDPNKSSIPTWMGPQHYPDAGKIPSYNIHDGQYRVPFKAAPRDGSSEDVQRRQAVSRRRRTINEQKQRISAEESLAGTGSMTSFFTAFEEGSANLEPNVLTESALEMAKQDKLGDECAEFDLVLNPDDDGGGSLASSVTLFSRSRAGTGAHKKLTVGFLDESMDATAAQSQVSTPRTAASSLYSQVRSKSILHTSLVHTNAPMPKKQARVPNPIFSQKNLTTKLMKMDERHESQFFKVKDYTMNAFAIHSPEPVYADEFEPADIEVVPDESAGVYQNRTHGPYRKNKPIGTFTSEIFHVKPPEYVPHKPAADTPNASTKTASSPSTKSTKLMSSKSQPRLAPIMSSRSLLTATIDRPMSSSKETREPAQPKIYKPQVLSKDIEMDRIKSERTINKIIQRRHDSRYFAGNTALVDEASLMSGGEEESITTPGKGTNVLVTNRKSVDRWLDANDIIRGPIGKRVEGASFLEAHKPLPSIALSLSGLLLENNPYTPEDDFIKDLFHKPASEIGL